MDEIQIKKKEINNLIIYKKKINKLMDIFLNNYNDIFIKKDLIKYDDIIDLDFKIKEIFLEFLVIVKSLNCTKIKNLEINKIFNNLLNATVFEIETFHKDKMFDILYHSYILVQIFLISSYLLSDQIFEYKLQKIKLKKKCELNQNEIDRLHHKSCTTYIAKYVFKDIKIFKKWDQLEQKIDTINFELEEQHSSLQDTYIKTHKKFKILFNNFYLMNLNYKESNYINKLGMFLNYYYVLIIMILLIGLAIFLIVYFQPSKN